MSKETFPAGNVPQHSLAELVPGGMSEEEFEALCISIREDGQQFPIMLFEDRVLDGRHRLRACLKLKITPKFAHFAGTLAEATQFVLAANLNRKTLSSMQKALVGARMCNPALPKPLTQKDAAARVGVGVATINLAIRLIESKNTPLIKRCERGECTRAEIDEELYDRSFRAAPQPTTAEMLGGDDPAEDDDSATAPGAVASRDIHVAVGNKPKHPERKATTTPANDVAQMFIGLDEANKKSFIELTWFALEPLVRSKLFAAGDPPAETPKEAPVGKGKKAKPKSAAAAAAVH